MSDATRGKDRDIARLLSQLADLGGEEPAMAALRREADAFDPLVSTIGVVRDLLALETDETERKRLSARLDELLSGRAP